MKNLMKNIASVLSILLASASALAQSGNPYIHDPSSIVECDGKYYTFGTGSGGLISEDGWTWNSGAVRPGGGAAPDAIKIGDRYLVIYGTTGGGTGGGHASAIMTMWNKTLDPDSPDFGYTEAVKVAESLIDEDFNAIDPASCWIPLREGFGLPAALISVTSAYSNSTPGLVSAWRAMSAWM